MPSAPRLHTAKVILHVGDDPAIAEARRLILRKAGYSVITVKATAHAAHVPQSRTVDAVVFCHTVPWELVDDLIRQMRNLGLHTPVLSIYTGHLAEGYSTLSDAYADGLHGPETLLRALSELFLPPQSRAVHALR